MNLCTSCQEKIPNVFVVNGTKKKVSNNRTQCFNCKPFGKKGRTNASSVAKTMCNYQNWPEEWKKEHQAKTRLRGEDKKQKMIQIKGGCCEICGYNKSLRALTFHHRDPSNKKFGLDKENTLRHSWNEILEELQKCNLLCANCHFELEESLFRLNI